MRSEAWIFAMTTVFFVIVSPLIRLTAAMVTNAGFFGRAQSDVRQRATVLANAPAGQSFDNDFPRYLHR